MGQGAKHPLSVRRKSRKVRAKCAAKIRWRQQQTLCTQSEELSQQTSEVQTVVEDDNRPNIMPPDECTEESTQEVSSQIKARRIVNIHSFMSQILGTSRHTPFDCSIVDMEIIQEVRHGLVSDLHLKCKFCNETKIIKTDDTGNEMYDINTAIAVGALSIGIGYSQIDELMATTNIPFMSPNTYQVMHRKVADKIHACAWESMALAAEEEKRIALEVGDISNDGTPYITVICDGAWSKRSYKSNYNAASGAACIIGAKTGKLLFLGIKNKYCCICAKAEYKKENAASHLCFRNWQGPSTAMEADILVEGFRKSRELHGVMYKRMVGDGDSSVHKRLLQERPYGFQLVEKVECRNHLLRNMCNHLRDVSSRTKSNSSNHSVPVYLRKVLQNSIGRIRACIQKATMHHIKKESTMDEKIKELNTDILNSISHVFGEHEKCSEIGYFCNGQPKENEKNLVPPMKECGQYTDIKQCLYRLVHNCSSLLTNMNTNAAESYNAVLCKFVGGKRVNFSLRDSYMVRAEAVAFSYNSKGRYHNIIGKALNSGALRCDTFTEKYVSKILRQKYMRKKGKASVMKERASLRKRAKVVASADKHYGPEAGHEMPEEDVISLKEDFLKQLKKNKEEITSIEKSTRGQTTSALWYEERSKRITASCFGEICRMRKTTSPLNKIKTMLYNSFLGNIHTKYGQDHEATAIEEFQKIINKKIEQCGFFIDENYPFLGASPDGLIDNDSLIEVKCPSTCRNMHPMEALLNKKIGFANIDENNCMKLKEKHKYYYQVQGQLMITKRSYCYFVIWTPLGIVFEKIERNDDFCKKMVETLEKFYMSHILPELINPKLNK